MRAFERGPKIRHRWHIVELLRPASNPHECGQDRTYVERRFVCCRCGGTWHNADPGPWWGLPEGGCVRDEATGDGPGELLNEWPAWDRFVADNAPVR